MCEVIRKNTDNEHFKTILIIILMLQIEERTAKRYTDRYFCGIENGKNNLGDVFLFYFTLLPIVRCY